MFWPNRKTTIEDRQLVNLTVGDNLAEQRVRIKLPQGFPIAGIHIRHDFRNKSEMKANMKPYGLLGSVKNIELNVQGEAGGKPTRKVNISGTALTKINLNEGLCLDPATQATVASYWDSVNGYAANQYVRNNYFLWCCPQNFLEPARTRMLLPVWKYTEQPELVITLASAADLSAVTDPYISQSLAVSVYGQELNSTQRAAIEANGGFVDWDLMESSFGFDTSLTNVQKALDIPSPGNYTGLYIEHRSGAAIPTLAALDASTTAGQETEWTLEFNEQIKERFRMADINALNALSKPGLNPHLAQIAAAAGRNYIGSGEPGPAPTYAQGFPTTYCAYLDFVSDMVGGSADELGSLLAAATQGALRWQLKGRITTPATAGSEIRIAGRRLYDGPAFNALISKLALAK